MASSKKGNAPKSNVPAIKPKQELQQQHDDIDVADFAGAGMEKMTADDFSVPRLQILQKGSPQVDKTNSAFIKGAEVGMILNTVTGELFDGEKGIYVVPVSYARNHIEWRLRKNGGGFVKNHGISPAILEQCKKDEETGANIHHNGNEVVPTSEYFCFLLDDVDFEAKDWSPVVISMAKTQQRKAKNWNTLANKMVYSKREKKDVPAPLYYNIYHLTTVPESNDKGSWYGWSIQQKEEVTARSDERKLFWACSSFQKKIDAGVVAAAPPIDDSHAAGASDGDAI